MGQKRTTPIYGNSQVFSPEGHLMFRCLEKRAKWYLDRNLATIIKENPLSVQLTFTPKGKGETKEALKTERYNKCVVCGTEDMDKLTKHHIVPFVYRQHFPEKRKGHSSLFVLPICKECHMRYENDYANKLKTILADAYSAPMNGEKTFEKDKIIRSISSLIDYGDKIPADRKLFLIDKIKNKLLEIGIIPNPNYNLTDREDLSSLMKDIQGVSQEKKFRNHGEIVVESITDFDEFEIMWSKHFIDHMKPQYISQELVNILLHNI